MIHTLQRRRKTCLLSVNRAHRRQQVARRRAMKNSVAFQQRLRYESRRIFLSFLLLPNARARSLSLCPYEHYGQHVVDKHRSPTNLTKEINSSFTFEKRNIPLANTAQPFVFFSLPDVAHENNRRLSRRIVLMYPDSQSSSTLTYQRRSRESSYQYHAAAVRKMAAHVVTAIQCRCL